MGIGSDEGDLVSIAVDIVMASSRLSVLLGDFVVGFLVEGLKDAIEASATADAISLESIVEALVVESFFVLFDSDSQTGDLESLGRLISFCKTISIDYLPKLSLLERRRVE